MKPRQNPFRLSAMNSLKVHEVPIQNQKQLMNTFKGNSDLRRQLNKNVNLGQNNSKTFNYMKTMNNTNKLSQTMKVQKPQSEALMDEVAALDNFKVPVTREKTKNLVENIKLRRREKHIQAYNNFREDLDDYKQNLLQIYQSLYSDCSQVLSIKQQQLQGYFHSQTDEYLLTREKDLLTEFKQQLQSYKKTSWDKILASRQELERIKNGRGDVVNQTCQILRQQLIEIAFVLEEQARSIEQKEKDEINDLQRKIYSKYAQQLQQLSSQQQQSNESLESKMLQVSQKWRQLKQSHQISSFQQTINSEPYINSIKKQQLYQQLIKLQQTNHEWKKKCLESLVGEEHVDSLRKVNVQKWMQLVKSVNEEFDHKLDNIVKELMDEHNQAKQLNHELVTKLQQRLRYIENHTPEEITQMLATKFHPMVEKNNTASQQHMKKATSYIELNDQKENTLLENFYKFFSTIAQTNDDFVKEFTSMNQKHELEKAKILDDDEELVEKLNGELEAFKKQLRESLHHLKLEEVQKKCFEKIDEIQVAYRKTHQKNKELTAARPALLKKFMQEFEEKMAFVFQLYEQAKRAQLVQRNKQDADKEAMRRIEEQDKKKAQQQQKQLQLIKKNGGKAPPPAKPKDPKKLAAQIQERKKAILTQMGQKKIQELKTSSGNTWLVYKTLQTIAKQFYQISSPPGVTEPQQQQNHNQDILKPLQIDELPEPVVNSVGEKITTSVTIFKVKEVAELLLKLRDKIFQNVGLKKTRILEQADKSDSEMMEQSLQMLDDRLKRHYSLKGQLQAQIFTKRSGQITNHKKRYEKYARTIRQKMDTQTQRFNFLLQKGLELLKSHNLEQKLIKEQLPSGKNLSELQGLLGKARENFNKFTQEVNQIVAQLNHLAKTQVQILLEKNKDFIKESRLIKDGGQYSEEEVKWYEEMMSEITDLIKQQQSKRQQKAKEIQQQSDKRKKQLLQKIEKDYHSNIQQLSAKQGTGKVYGKPKRIAQQKIRLQMNKCQQSQISISQQISSLQEIHKKHQSHNFQFTKRPETISWRHKLMTLYVSIERYARHLQALKKDLKIKPMPRVNYDENVPDCTVSNLEEDKKLIEDELKALGPLGQQKEDKPFMKFVADIQKIISDQARTIYTGDKAKYLTGADKVPDFLRKYIASMRQSAEDFRQNSIRQLRQSCNKLSQLCEQIGELFIASLESYFISRNQDNFSTQSKQFSSLILKHDQEKTQNLRLLRPNLSNPKCQQQLKALNAKQLARQAQFIKQLSTLKESFKSNHFSNGQSFINCLINNYEFLIQYCDSLYLFEDFVKVAGDDDEDKKKLNIKKLIVMKQKGLNIDSSSERNLKKKWAGVDFTVVNFDDKKFTYKKMEQQDPAAKDPKKAAKKDAKKPQNQVPQQIENLTTSKQIQTFKTWRQKTIFQQRQKCLDQFRKTYTQTIAQMYAKIDQSIKENQMFSKKWTKIADELVLK